MSEAFPGIDFRPPPAKIRPAAAVIVVRESPERQVFWVRRGEALSFSGGFYAFPGGKVDPADEHVPLSGAPPGEAALRACAIRETFEETGLLLGQPLPDPDRLAALRKELLDGADFATLMAREGITLEADALIAAGRWVTPDFSPVRFDARFYLVQAPAGARLEVIAGELSDGGWIAPAEALARWEAGTALLHPPNHHALAMLAGFGTEAAIPRLRRPPFVDEEHVAQRIEFQRGVLYLPLRTPTLPPAQHTNCYVLGTGALAVVDPGAHDPLEQRRLIAYLEELEREGRTVRAVVLTHHHQDHVGAARAVAARFSAPLLASAATRERVPEVTATLGDGDTLDLDGPLPMRWRVLVTEGHARGHLCLRDERSSAVIAGDMVAGGSTIVIDPPEGDMGVYLASLRRLLALPPGTLYPAHGFPIPDGARKLDEYVAHREARLEQIATALEEGPLTLPALVVKVYTDTPAVMYPAAERSALASVIELEKRGRVIRRGEAIERI